MLSCAGLSAGVEPGEGEALNGVADVKGREGGENKGKERKGRGIWRQGASEKERTRTESRGDIRRGCVDSFS